MTYFTEENMTTLNVALMIRELFAMGKLGFVIAVDVERANNSLLCGAVRGVFPSRNPEDWRLALRCLLCTPLVEAVEADVLWLLAELSEGRLKTT